ncbi:ABC transporter ATP-binding protein [Bacillus pumilus]|nr:ABC transporter ATP-binding protein [Bacillus pumilus]PRS32111.1 ABC transporter ATP-binding protein [Bacillus pumilus]
MEYVLEVQKVSKKYSHSDFQLRDISFKIPKSSIVGFIGENGAGKTSTFGTILSSLKKQNGTIKIFDKVEPHNDISIKENIGVVFDNNNFSENISITQLSKVLSNIYRQWDNEKFFKYIDLFSLPKNGLVGKLSRGMSMKLSISVALSHNAKLLLLDEATSGLDPVCRDEVLTILKDYVKNNECSILLSSHIISDIELIADHLIFIKSGEILLDISKSKLLDDYSILECKSKDLEMVKEIALAYTYKNKDLIEVLVSNDKVIPDRFFRKNSSLNEITLMLLRGKRI